MRLSAHREPALEPPWRLGVDVGGTFTDLAVVDARGATRVYKVPSVIEDPARGVLGVLELAATDLGVTLEELLAGCELIVHGTTVATNTVLEGKGARVGLLVSAGFRDTLEIRRGLRRNQWDHRAPFAPVLVPRSRRLPVRGRIDRRGAELAPLELADVDSALEAFAESGVESIAICLYNSFLEGDHERRCAVRCRESWGGDWISLSSELLPVTGEYGRTATTVMNAYLAPSVAPYLASLAETLAAAGLRRRLLLLQSNGGVLSAERLAERPVQLLLSGPAAGVGALERVSEPLGCDDLIAMEVGGTSCDVTLMAGGAVALSDELRLGGYDLAVPALDIHTVAAGGGTIARVDPAGLLQVGPQGAGAVPGPAAYGRGGEEATVTDAQLVLGRLRPGSYAGGAIELALEPARQALARRVAEPLGIDVEAAARGIVRLLEQQLVHAVEEVSLVRGRDPRQFVLVAAGGAGPLHGGAVARRLGCRQVLVPRQAGVFCALGMLAADVRLEESRAFLCELEEGAACRLERGFVDLDERAASRLEAEGLVGERQCLQCEAELRYRGQQSSLRVAVPVRAGSDWIVALRQAFEAEHDRLFGHSQPHGRVEVTALHVVGRGLLGAASEGRSSAPSSAQSAEPQSSAGTAEPQSSAQPPAPATRRVWMELDDEWVEAPVIAEAELGPAGEIVGPAILEASTTTVLLDRGDRLSITALGDWLIDLAPATTDPRETKAAG